jgi:hypothetical protein
MTPGPQGFPAPVAFILLVILSLSAPAVEPVAGQTGTAATIIGQVTDESGAVLPVQ